MSDTAAPFTTRLEGPAPEVSVSRDIVRRGLMVAPVLVAVCGVIWGVDGAWSSAYAIVLVLLNFGLAAAFIAVTARISLGLMMIPETVLGIVIHLSPVVLYPSYETSVAALGVDPLTDQKFAGALAWALTMVIDGIWAMIAAWEWFRDEERRAVREEALVAA